MFQPRAQASAIAMTNIGIIILGNLHFNGSDKEYSDLCACSEAAGDDAKQLLQSTSYLHPSSTPFFRAVVSSSSLGLNPARSSAAQASWPAANRWKHFAHRRRRLMARPAKFGESEDSG